jgi:hypothetical protein
MRAEVGTITNIYPIMGGFDTKTTTSPALLQAAADVSHIL